LVVDGFSEQKVTSRWRSTGGKLVRFSATMFPHSIGCYYAAITDYLGYQPFSDEWKVMGMAAYGNAAEFPQIRKLIHLQPDGDYELELSCFDFYNFDRPRFFSDRMERLLGEPPRQRGQELTRRHFDLAAAAQAFFEEVMIHILSWLHHETGCTDL